MDSSKLKTWVGLRKSSAVVSEAWGSAVGSTESERVGCSGGAAGSDTGDDVVVDGCAAGSG